MRELISEGPTPYLLYSREIAARDETRARASTESPLSHRDLHPSGLPKLWIVRQVRVQGIYGYPRHLKMHSYLIVYLIHLFDELFSNSIQS